MGQNESVAASRDHQTKRNDASSRQQPRPSQTQQQHSSDLPSSTSTSSSISTTRAPHGSLSLIKESPSPSPPTFLTTISQQFAERTSNPSSLTTFGLRHQLLHRLQQATTREALSASATATVERSISCSKTASKYRSKTAKSHHR